MLIHRNNQAAFLKDIVIMKSRCIIHLHRYIIIIGLVLHPHLKILDKKIEFLLVDLTTFPAFSMIN